jgi:surface antigen
MAARVAIAVVLLGACGHGLLVADARGHHLRPGASTAAYPWATAGPTLDPWGFVTRQCTSYAAWFLNAHGVPFGLLTRGPAGDGLFTSAGSWDGAAAAAGFPVRSTPVVGSIAQWDPGEASPAGPPGAAYVAGGTAGPYGHVAVVREVRADGAVVVSEYDGADGSFHVRLTRAPRYLYVGVSIPPHP